MKLVIYNNFRIIGVLSDSVGLGKDGKYITVIHSKDTLQWLTAVRGYEPSQCHSCIILVYHRKILYLLVHVLLQVDGNRAVFFPRVICERTELRHTERHNPRRLWTHIKNALAEGERPLVYPCPSPTTITATTFLITQH